jgi:aconitate decarboxylase
MTRISGLEAALLADKGLEGNSQILDMVSGFGAFYEDYDPEIILNVMKNTENVLLHDQDIAIKRYPCHLGMHWGRELLLIQIERISQNAMVLSSFRHLP